MATLTVDQLRRRAWIMGMFSSNARKQKEQQAAKIRQNVQNRKTENAMKAAEKADAAKKKKK